MQVVEGRNLREWLADPEHAIGTHQRLEGALEIMLRVCDALAYAHSQGYLHRDVKPDNVMVGRHGRVYLMDWGLAISKEMAGEGPVGVGGTPRYMAPEVAQGLPIDERVDIFGLGAVLFEVVTGSTPYGETDALKGGPSSIRTVEQRMGEVFVAPELRAIVDKAVAPDREDRYASVEALQHDLRRFLRGGRHLPRKVFAPGEVIVLEGETGDSAFLILEGSCRVVQQSGDGAEGVVELRRMEPGAVFGELAVLLDRPRTATVIAETETAVLVIDRAALGRGGVLDGWSSVLLEALAQRFAELEQKVRNSLPSVDCSE
jgi:serine/threonine-protein kinase